MSSVERKVMAKFLVGSHLYGLARPESDLDYMGVVFPLPEDIMGMTRVDSVDDSTKSSSDDRRNTSEDVDDKSLLLHRYTDLLMRNKAMTIELLFATPKCIVETTPEWEELIANRDRIVTKKVYHEFGSYAMAQRRKLIVKSERYTSLESAIKMMKDYWTDEQLYSSKSAITEDESNMLNNTLKYYKGQKENCESFHVGMPLAVIYEKIVAEHKRYGWRVKTPEFEKIGYDPKFGYNLIRLLAEGVELLETGGLSYPLKGEVREDIIAIREARVSYEELLVMCDKYKARLDEVFKTTKLPEKCDKEWLDAWCVRTALASLK